MAYLDYNATSPMRAEARQAAEHALAVGGNASSVHGVGRAARATIEQAREYVAALAGARAQNVIFTSGGTEANALALWLTILVPLLYALGARQPGDSIAFPVEGVDGGSVSMLAVRVGA